MAIMIMKRDGTKELLDITKIQQMVVEVTEELSDLAEDIKETTDVALKKAKINQYRLKEIEKGRHKQQLIKCIKLLTTQTKENIANSTSAIQIFLKNIFGHNNSTEADHNK